ncbi:MAG TPA: lysylphosphatidylglycerol synthase transmembrane domain-containing protein, partial [Actinomycetota bacterium]|nr:lysylphosphatidylglycerol synthase transmembrane domain-containing protein [Actinomycetota bacterium]
RAQAARRRVLKIVQIALFPIIAIVVFVGVLPRIADFDQVWAIITNLSAFEVAVLVLLTAWNLVTYWPMLVAAMPGLSLGQAAVVCQTSTSVAMTVPAGGAIAVGVAYALYSSWGFTVGEVAISAMATFVSNMSFKLLLPAISLGVLAATGQASGDGLPAAVAGLAVFLGAFGVLVLALRNERFARWIGNVADRTARAVRLRGRAGGEPWGESAVRFRGRIVGLFRTRGWMLAAAELVSQLAVYLVLLASVRFTGTPDAVVSWAEVLAVFAFVRLVTAMPIIPGNVGLAELGYIGGLVLAGSGRPQAVAAVLLFRFLTYYAQIPIGGITWIVWQRRTSWRVPSHRTRQQHGEGPEPLGDPAPDPHEHEGDPPEHAPHVREQARAERDPRPVDQAQPGDDQQAHVAHAERDEERSPAG